MKLARIALHQKTMKLLALGFHQLDFEALKNAVQGSQFLLVAGDKCTGSRNNTFPVFVAFRDRESDYPWWEMLKTSSMEDKTVETQARFFYGATVDELEIPPQRLLSVLGGKCGREWKCS